MLFVLVGGLGGSRRPVEPLEARRLLSAWYVAPTGSDSDPGTLDRPFATIQQAADVAQPGDTVFVRGGTYRQTVLPTNSGAPGAPITFKNYNNETVTIDGADPIGSWSRLARGIYQAPLPSDLGSGKNQIFDDSRMMIEAQWPATPSYLARPTFARAGAVRLGSAISGLSTATITAPGLNDPPNTWVGATIHIAPGQEWVFQTGTVIASAPGSITYTYQQLGPSTYQIPSAGNRFYLTGSRQALGAPGEWYRDPTSGMLDFRPPHGSPMGQAVEAKHRLYGFDLSGRSYIDVVGFHLFACTINTDAGSSHNTIDGIDAKYVSHDMIDADPWAAKFHPHTSGIILNGTGNVLQNSTIAFSSGDGVFLGGSNNSVQNCLIHDVDYSGGDYAGVSTLGVADRVASNTIYNCARGGVVVRFSPGVSVVHNRILSCGLITTDVGGVYTWQTDGQGSEIAYNLISDIRTGGFGGAGIYLDNGAANYLLDHNVVWNADAALRMNPPSNGNRVYNNTLWGVQKSLDSATPADMTGSSFINDLLIGPAMFGPGASETTSLVNARGIRFQNARRGDLRLRPKSAGTNAGQVLPPYTDGYVGTAPDIGAYESGLPPFSVGASLPLPKRQTPQV